MSAIVIGNWGISSAVGGGPPTLVRSTAGNGSGTSLTVSNFDAEGSGTAPYLLVGLRWTGGADLVTVTVTYNSVSMTEIGRRLNSGNSVEGVALFGLVAPSSGLNSVVVTVSPSQSNIRAFPMAWTGINQSTPTGTFAPADTATAPSLSVNASSAVGDVVVDILDCLTGTPTISGGQTAIQNVTVAACSYKAGGTPTTTMSYSFSPDSYGTIGAVALKPV